MKPRHKINVINNQVNHYILNSDWCFWCVRAHIKPNLEWASQTKIINTCIRDPRISISIRILLFIFFLQLQHFTLCMEK